MVSFRYHLVSLTAVFLALAIGIAMGATVVDRATVDFLETRLSGVEANNNRTDARNKVLTAEMADWDRFAGQADDHLVQGRLTDVRVLVIAVAGTSRGAVTATNRALASAGAIPGGVLWLTERLRLSSPEDLAAIGPLVGEPSARAASVRPALFSALADALVAGPPAADVTTTTTTTAEQPAPTLLTALATIKAVTFDRPEGGTEADLVRTPAPGSRLVLLSAGTSVETVGLPLVRALASRNQPIVAGDTTPEPSTSAEDASPFVRPLRMDASLAPRVSTIDHAPTFRGRVALVLAVADVGRGRFGHYGTEPRSTRIIPAL